MGTCISSAAPSRMASAGGGSKTRPQPTTTKKVFARHAISSARTPPYSALKTTLKAEINADAWATLNSDTSGPFDKPKSDRIVVKVINHLGD